MPVGGMGAVAETLVKAVENHGGRVLYRHRAERLVVEGGGVKAVEVVLGGRRKGQRERLGADLFLANLTPGDLAALHPVLVPRHPPKDGWGAFMLHAVVPETLIPPGPSYRQWAGSGDWTFISLSDAGDGSRGPQGMRVLSASVHTPLAEWRGLLEPEYVAQKKSWQERVIAQVERVIPGFQEASPLILGATPRTFAFYTSRADGWVGGYPQTHPLRTSSPRTGFSNLFRVGDTVFPGQSVPAVAMGGLRVAELALSELGGRLQPAPHLREPHV